MQTRTLFLARKAISYISFILMDHFNASYKLANYEDLLLKNKLQLLSSLVMNFIASVLQVLHLLMDICQTKNPTVCFVCLFKQWIYR